MNLLNPYKVARVILVAVSALLISPGLLADEAESSSLGNVVLPNVMTPKDIQKCVEPTDVMRRDHMKFLLHQRDDTVLDGIRTKKYSLTGCIDCHAQPADDGKIVRAENPEYFCTACHVYTSVSIDCFECHSDQPSVTAKKISRTFSTHEILAGIDSSRASRSLLQQVERRDD